MGSRKSGPFIKRYVPTGRYFVQDRIAEELRKLNGASLPAHEFEERVCRGLKISHDTYLKHLSNYNIGQQEEGGVIAQSTFAIRGYSAEVVSGYRRHKKKD
jgi:hypothetical protein